MTTPTPEPTPEPAPGPTATPASSPARPAPTTAGGRLVDWLFRNRETGRLAIAQAPNPPLLAFIALVVLRSVAHPAGTVGTIVDGLATAAIAGWALDEIVRGVNPWRRILGTVVLASTVAGIVARGSLT